MIGLGSFFYFLDVFGVLVVGLMEGVWANMAEWVQIANNDNPYGLG